jgi:hypothetical protein
LSELKTWPGDRAARGGIEQLLDDRKALAIEIGFKSFPSDRRHRSAPQSLPALFPRQHKRRGFTRKAGKLRAD